MPAAALFSSKKAPFPSTNEPPEPGYFCLRGNRDIVAATVLLRSGDPGVVTVQFQWLIPVIRFTLRFGFSWKDARNRTWMVFPQRVGTVFSYLHTETLLAPMRVVSLAALVSPFWAVLLLLARLMPVDTLPQKMTRQFLNASGLRQRQNVGIHHPGGAVTLRESADRQESAFCWLLPFPDLLILVKHTDFFCMGLTYDQ